tara:strand:- start:453 stop:1559 length:1107 start_codon:yes stop_codon:yes gene_type:complete
MGALGTRRFERLMETMLTNDNLGGLNGSPFSIRNPDRVYYEEYYTQLPHVNAVLFGSETKDFGSIADGNEEAEEVTVTGAALGDFALASLSIDAIDLAITAEVTAANTVTVVVLNNTGGALDLGSATLSVQVIKAGNLGSNAQVNPNFQILGTNASSDDVTFAATTAGILLQPDGADGDQLVVAPHLDTNQTAWTSTKWGTENQLQWECCIRTDASDIDDTTFWSGLKLTSTPTMATDANQAYFIYGAEDDDAGALTTNANLHFVYSVAGTDFITDLGITVAAATNYRLGIQIDSSRKISCFVDGEQYNLVRSATAGGAAAQTQKGADKSLALTNDIDFIPYVGIMNQAATQRDMVLYYQKMSRILFE